MPRKGTQVLGGLIKCEIFTLTFNFLLIDTVNKLHQKEEQFNVLSSELEKLRENLTGKAVSAGD